MAAFALSLASSVSWGISDFVGGMLSRRVHVLVVVLFGQAIGLLLAVAMLPVLGDAGLNEGELAIAAAGGAAGAVGLIAYYAGMATGTISVVSPIAALGVILPVAVGLANGEEPAALQLTGVVVAMLAVVLVSYEESAEGAKTSLKPVLLALVAALGFGLFFVAVNETADKDYAWTIAAVRTGGVAVAIGGVIAVRPSFQRGEGRFWAPILAIGFFDVSANSLYAVASTEGLLPVVAVGGSLYPAITILLAFLVLGERLRGIRLGGVLLALVGIVMIAAGS